MYVSRKDITIVQKDRILTHLPFLIDYIKKLNFSLFCENSIDYELSAVHFNEYFAFSQLNYYQSKCPRVLSTINKILQSNYRKRSRVACRFEKMFNKAVSPIYFGTLTFTDSVLENTSCKTRRVYVSRFLKNISQNYLANIDFGDLNNREHYHCIFECSNIDLFKKWNYGFVNVKVVRYSKLDIKRCSKYLVKLINHCVKGSAGFLISSRNKKR